MKKWYNRLFLNDIRAAVEDYELIVDNDKILVGLSGGKDSIFLLYTLILLRERSYLNFDIIACHIDIGLNIDMNETEKFCKRNKVPFINEKIYIEDKISNSKKSPCYICSNYKRGTMATIAKKLNANKIAYGHHLTDLVDTFILNIVKENSFRVFKALTYNKKHNLSLIRPLIYIKEDIIIKVVEYENLPLGKGELCSYDNKNERNKVNKIVEFSNTLYEDFENHVLKSLKDSDLL